MYIYNNKENCEPTLPDGFHILLDFDLPKPEDPDLESSNATQLTYKHAKSKAR